MKILWTLLAAIVCVSTSTQFGSAAQMVLKLEGDPESYFAAPDHPSLDQEIGSNLTVEAWIYPALTVEENGLEMMIVNKEDQYEIADVIDQFAAAIKPAGVGWDYVYSGENFMIPAKTWTHVAATWDGLLVKLYVNGKFAVSDDRFAGPDGAKGTLNVNDEVSSRGTATLKIGRRGRGDAERHSIFNGFIDEVRISKSVRYTEAGFAVPAKAFVPDADTVALYHFDEVSTVAGDIQSLQARFVTNGRTDDNGDGELDPELGIRAVVKDASGRNNHGGFTGPKISVVVPESSPITDTP
jgi:hypothetical protein